MQHLIKKYSEACRLVGSAVDTAIVSKASDMVMAMGTTRSEALLLRLYNSDGMKQYNAEERDIKTRAIKKEAQRFSKWASVFLPIRQRAAEAMKRK
eukprot:1073609-Pyramimonas_sp.AAC.1